MYYNAFVTDHDTGILIIFELFLHLVVNAFSKSRESMFHGSGVGVISLQWVRYTGAR